MAGLSGLAFQSSHFEKVLEKPYLKRPIAMDGNRDSNGAAGLSIYMVASVDPSPFPSVFLKEGCQLLA